MARSKGPVGPGLLLELDRGAELPLHEQIERSIREDVRAGRLAAGTQLPSSRALAAELGVSRGVVSEAFGQLAAEGYLLARQGASMRVAGTVRGAAAASPTPSLRPRYAYRLDPCLPDLAGFPRDRWLRSLRAAWREAPIDAIDYPDPRGVPELRRTLADYLGRARGAAADAEQILVCAGFSQGLSLIARWLAGRGVERIALEDPGWHSQRLIVEQAGLEVAPIGVDAEGLKVEELERSDAAAVIVTPAHQFPSGAVMSSARRAALIEWAELGEHLIVEDDFDAELRYDRARVGSLQGLAPERVAHIGSLSKRLAPGMRLGWILAPSWLGWPLTSVRAIEDRGPDAAAQLALHDFVERGELDRHLRRTRLRYGRRREALLAALERDLPEARPRTGAAGLFELIELPRGSDETALLAAAAERGLGVEGLSLHRFRPGGPGGLVLGFASLAEPALERAVRILAEAWAESQGR